MKVARRLIEEGKRMTEEGEKLKRRAEGRLREVDPYSAESSAGDGLHPPRCTLTANGKSSLIHRAGDGVHPYRLYRARTATTAQYIADCG